MMFISSIKINKNIEKMNAYKTFPPEYIFLNVLKACPKEALIYLHIWKGQNENGFFSIKKENIRVTLQISPTIFRNSITNLSNFGFISFENESNEDFMIYIYG